MSSAALQTPAGLPTSSRRYTSSHASPARDPYHATKQSLQQQVSSSRPSRNATIDSPSPVHSSAAVTAAAVSMSDYPHSSPAASSDRRRHAPPVAPPRTSSNRHDQPPSASAPVATAPAVDARRRRESRPSGIPESSQRRQRSQAAPEEYAQRRSTSTRTTSTTMPIRTVSAADQSSPHTPVRETSEILNAVVVSRDEVDIERERTRLALAHNPQQVEGIDGAATPPVVAVNPVPDHIEGSHRRSRHDHSKREKQIKFGEYILGNTIGEGEFGKVKLGWKQEGGVQVAIKLIKKDSLGSNPTRMNKIMREVNILRQLNHPNIVQLHKMEESEHHYGIVLEYASGGELFDYILNHRYLKDHSARRLFAQLISGVGYLHKKGIVHRDLKLENLLLDRNRNIIITDFGFANTFDPTEELAEEEEANLADREWVKRMGFDRVKPNGMRKADLMQTSCGSPCYAAPELVVSDSLYTGRKVDVWSCGVILYAMLAGYLPFDDDPKNPEGDNINLLYKYIVNTPLTFPEYVTPHARDLLRRILVPDPRKRADLFEVARHSWLSEYASVVEFITSSTTSPGDIQNLAPSAEDMGENSMLGRSSSVREALKKGMGSSAIGGLTSKQGNIDPESDAVVVKQQKDNKRRTVQVEYVAPTTQTQRGEAQTTPTNGKTRSRPIAQGPVAISGHQTSTNNKPLPRDPPVSKDAYAKPQRESSRRPPSTHRNPNSSASTIPSTATTRANRIASDASYMTPGTGGRPVTGGSITSSGSRTGPNRASFGQPVPPTVAGTNAHGRIQQPTSGSARNYITSPQESSFGRPSISASPKLVPAAADPAGDGNDEPVANGSGQGSESKGHRRSNTLSDITDKLLGRNGSIFGGKNRKRAEQRQSVGGEKLSSRRYPPVSMSNTAASLQNANGEEPRASMESAARQSRRSLTLGLGKKRSGSVAPSQTSQEKQPHAKRFSLLPGSFSLKAIGLGRDDTQTPESTVDGTTQEPASARPSGGQENYDEAYDSSPTEQLHQQQQQHVQQQQHHLQHQQQRHVAGSRYEQQSLGEAYNQEGAGTLDSPAQYGAETGMQGQDPRRSSSRSGRVVLQKNKRFMDAYDTDDFAKPHDRSGSSGAARRVMDFFRRRGKARGGDD